MVIRPRAPRTLPLAVAAVVLLAGCGGTPEPAGADDLGLSAVAVYGRHAAVRGKVDVRLDNDGRRALRLERLQVRHPLFATVPPTTRSSTIPADGEPRIVPVPFGEPLCDGSADGEAVVVLGVRTEQGVEDVVVPLRDGEPGLLRAHRLACAAAAVQAAAAVSLGPPWSREGSRLRTALHLQRRGEGTVAVTQLTGNVLFTVDVRDDGDVLVLDPGRRVATVDVLVTASRCDPHALTESKRSSTFPLHASLDGGEPVLVPVTVDAAGRAALQELLADTCPALGAGRE